MRQGGRIGTKRKEKEQRMQGRRRSCFFDVNGFPFSLSFLSLSIIHPIKLTIRDAA